jgi:hypothetical protein
MTLWRERLPAPKKNQAATQVVEMIGTWQIHGGWSYRRLIGRLGLNRATFQRWQARRRRGLPALRPPGPSHPPLSAADSQTLDREVAGLRHGPRRTLGVGALRLRWLGVSRRELHARVRTERRRVQREQRASWQCVTWRQAGAAWSMDPGEQAGLCWNLVTDVCSRFRFDIQPVLHLPAAFIAERLLALFERFGPPLVLKRDNGRNLAHPLVVALLARFGVIPLPSPLYCPRYNGAVEFAQRELKGAAAILCEVEALPLNEALRLTPGLLNAKPRPCLDGLTAEALFRAGQPAIQHTYTLNHRKEIIHWIESRTRAIVNDMATDNRHASQAHAAAWRQATLTWLLDEGLLTLTPQPTNCHPIPPKNGPV